MHEKYGLGILIICLAIVLSMLVFIMKANATEPGEEVLIFRPDGTAEYCTTYEDGTVYCR